LLVLCFNIEIAHINNEKNQNENKQTKKKEKEKKRCLVLPEILKIKKNIFLLKIKLNKTY
jgi:vacuolar-type H+-ATPase subunit I/STV1